MSFILIRKNLANIISILRIMGACYMLSLPVFSKEFFIVYGILAATDSLDGTIARALNITSSFGAKLDSISDLILFGFMLWMVFPYLWQNMPSYIFWLIGICFVLRLFSYFVYYFKYHKFISHHTVLNKIAAFMMTLLPFILPTKYGVFYSLMTVLEAIAGVVYELFFYKEKAS